LLSLKSVQAIQLHRVNNPDSFIELSWHYVGSFIWRTNGRVKLIQIIQEAALANTRYGLAIQNLLGGYKSLLELAATYDEISSQQNYRFGRAGTPSYISFLVESAQAGKKIGSQRELAKLFAAKKQVSNR
jgi:hypothetical protein